MTLTETFNHILKLTLLWIRRESRQNKQEALLESPESISTPLGVITRQRHVDSNPDIQEGMRRARTRQYATRECKRLEK